MVVRVQWDFSDWQQTAMAIGAAENQVPYAMALAMNRAADITRSFLIRHTWPGAIKQRNASFIAASLTTRGARANKRSLSVEIYDRLNRGNLLMQALGGVRTPRGGSNLAIPASDIPRSGRGVPGRLRPRNMGNRAFKLRDKLYTRTTKGRLKLLYALKHATPIPRRVPFHADFAASMHREMMRTLPAAIQRAMGTAFNRRQKR
jgi:hypothetical protein